MRGAAALAFAVVLIAGSIRPVFAQVKSADSTSAAQSQSTLATTVERLQKHYQETNSFSANFKETVKRVGMMPQVRSGIVYYQKPGRMHWSFNGSQPETIVSDGSIIYDYDPGLNQVIETPVKSAFQGQSAAAFLMGVGNLNRDFDVAEAPGSSDGLENLKLTPKRDKSCMNASCGPDIEIGVDPASYNIAKLRMADALGNVTELQFTDVKINPSLSPSLFRFEVPKGADIVSPSGLK